MAREAVGRAVGAQLTPDTMVSLILQSEQIWMLIESFVTLVMKTRGFQLRRNHARVSSPRFSLPLPHAPHSEPILLEVSPLRRKKVGASRDRQRGILTYNFDRKCKY